MTKIKRHDLKTKSKNFKNIRNGIQTFISIRNDCNFEVEDILCLEEFNKYGYTGKYLHTEVVFVLDEIDTVKKDYVVLGLKLRLDRGANL